MDPVERCLTGKDSQDRHSDTAGFCRNPVFPPTLE